MKRNIYIISLASLVLLVGLVSITDASDTKFRLGLQQAHFVGGLSGILELSDPWALQGVIDFGAEAFAVRLLNRFHREEYWNAYGEGTLAIWSDRGYNYWGTRHHYDRNNNFGLGLGLGIEWDWRALSPTLPPIGWNIELGANVIPSFGINIGLGVHWKF